MSVPIASAKQTTSFCRCVTASTLASGQRRLYGHLCERIAPVGEFHMNQRTDLKGIELARYESADRDVALGLRERFCCPFAERAVRQLIRPTDFITVRSLDSHKPKTEGSVVFTPIQVADRLVYRRSLCAALGSQPV